VTKHQKRISGPLLDRIDIHIEVPRVDYEKLSADRVGETSESIRARVQAARNIQRERFRGRSLREATSGKQSLETLQSSIICNADMRVGEIRQVCLGVIFTSLFRSIGPYNAHWEVVCAGVVITIIPTLIMFLFLQKYIYNGLIQGAVK
jgi:hypothetical protein